MKREYHILNIVGILLLGFIFAIISNGGFNTAFDMGIEFFIGYMISLIAPAALILLIALIVDIFTKTNWKKMYIAAWGAFLLINVISIYGVMSL